MAWASVFSGILGGLGQGLGDYFNQKNQFEWNSQYQQQAYETTYHCKMLVGLLRLNINS